MLEMFTDTACASTLDASATGTTDDYGICNTTSITGSVPGYIQVACGSCPTNYYGTVSEGDCTACPSGLSAVAGSNTESSDCLCPETGYVAYVVNNVATCVPGLTLFSLPFLSSVSASCIDLCIFFFFFL